MNRVQPAGRGAPGAMVARGVIAAAALLLLPGAAPGGAAFRAGDVSVNPASLELGPVLPDSLARATVVVSNDGTTPLTLGAVTVSHPAFTAGSQSGGIPPGTTIGAGQTLPVAVSFRSAAAGTVLAVLTIPTDDPDEPETAVPLTGIVVPPPAVTVTPDSLFQELSPGEKVTRQIVIGNAGGSDLEWSLSVVPAAARQAPRPRAAPNLQGVGILWDRTHGQTATTAWTTVIDSLESLGATVTQLTGAGNLNAAALGSHRLYWSIDATQSWTAAERSLLATWTSNGGGVLLTGDNTSSVGLYNAVLGSLGSSVLYSTVPAVPSPPPTTDVDAHPVTQGVSSVYVGTLARTLTVAAPAETLFSDGSGKPVGAAEAIGLGRAVMLADEIFDDPTAQLAQSLGAQNLRLGLQAVEWLVGATWLTAPVAAGTVAADSQVTVDLDFDATGLAVGGTFLVSVRIATNDPLAPAVTIPVEMLLTGAPEIAVVPTSIDFGGVTRDSLATRNLRVRNDGVDTLNVSGITSTASYFNAIALPFQLVPGDSTNVVVTFLPDSIGAFTDTLVVANDDPARPALDVPVQGEGRLDCTLPCPPPSVRPADVQGSPGFRFPVEIGIAQSPAPVSAFGFTLTFDPALLGYADSVSVGAAAPGFVAFAQENQPGVLTCGGFGTAPIPAGVTGPVVQLHFQVACSTCVFGTTGDLILGGLTSGFAGLNACCGTFTLTQCPTGSGDVNADGQITPQDALCALKIYTGGGILPADPQCDGNGSCEVDAADADCSGAVDPTDALIIYNAWVAGLPPASCIGGGGAAAARRGPALRWGEPRPTEGEEVAVPLIAEGAPPAALGLEIELGGGARWAGAIAGETGVWPLLESGSPASGRVRVAGIDPAARSSPGEIAVLLIRPGADDNGEYGWVRAVGANGAVFAGPGQLSLGEADGPVKDGIAGVGPVPADGRLEVRYGVSRAGAAVELRILDVTGRSVRTLVRGAAEPGMRTAVWDGRDAAGREAATGIYFVQLRVDGRSWTRKVAQLR
jgi:hypothetical protein